MHKLIVKLSNHPSPLEPRVITGGLIEEEIYVEDIENIQDILDKVEKLVEIIDNYDKCSISIEVRCKSRGTILNGAIKGGSFSGVRCI